MLLFWLIRLVLFLRKFRIQPILPRIIVVDACVIDAAHVAVFRVGAREGTGKLAVHAKDIASMAARANAIIHEELHDDVNAGVRAVGDVLCSPTIPCAIPIHSLVGR